MFAIDLLKFRRSYVWTVIFLVPSIAVGIGAANYHANLALLNADGQAIFPKQRCSTA